MPRSTLARRTPTRINISMPRASRLARRAGGAAARAALDEKHTLASVGAAAVLGYMARSGTTLPHVDALGVAGTYGLVAWAAGRGMRNRTLSHIATGLLSVQAYSWARSTTALPGPTAASMGEFAGVI